MYSIEPIVRVSLLLRLLQKLQALRPVHGSEQLLETMALLGNSRILAREGSPLSVRMMLSAVVANKQGEEEISLGIGR